MKLSQYVAAIDVAAELLEDKLHEEGHTFSVVTAKHYTSGNTPPIKEHHLEIQVALERSSEPCTILKVKGNNKAIAYKNAARLMFNVSLLDRYNSFAYHHRKLPVLTKTYN